jgi:hypothetical protein
LLHYTHLLTGKLFCFWRCVTTQSPTLIVCAWNFKICWITHFKI